MRVLIFGGSGQLGSQLLKFFPEAFYTYRNNKVEGGIKLDFLSFMELENVILKLLPEVVINTVAVTDVDLCEKDKKYAYLVNAESVKHIVRAARAVNAYLVHISTDYVFDGNKGLYNEQDVPNPINYYGLTKLIGETYALSYDYSIVIRTSGVFLKKGFPAFVYQQLKDGKKVYAFKGFYSPISAFKLAESIADLVKFRQTGILNIAGERISRYEFAMKIAEIYNLPKNIEESDIINWVAKRPYDSSLDITKAKTLLNNNFYDIEENIKHLNQ